jgi:hypothetical protein
MCTNGTVPDQKYRKKTEHRFLRRQLRFFGKFLSFSASSLFLFPIHPPNSYKKIEKIDFPGVTYARVQRSASDTGLPYGLQAQPTQCPSQCPKASCYRSLLEVNQVHEEGSVNRHLLEKQRHLLRKRRDLLEKQRHLSEEDGWDLLEKQRHLSEEDDWDLGECQSENDDRETVLKILKGVAIGTGLGSTILAISMGMVIRRRRGDM